MHSLKTISEICAPVIITCAVGITYASWYLASKQILEGMQTFVRAKYALYKISGGFDISPEDCWVIIDSKIDPYASLCTRLSGGKKAILKAYRERKINNLEES